MQNWNQPFEIFQANKGFVKNKSYCCGTTSIEHHLNRILFKLTTSGRGLLNYKNQNFQLKEGNLFIIDRSIKHDYKMDPKSKSWAFIYFSIQTSDANYYIPPKLIDNPVMNLSKRQDIIKQIENMVKNHVNSKQELARFQTFQIHSHLINMLNLKKSRPIPKVAKELKCIFENNFLTGQNIKELTQDINLRAETLSRIFKESYGMSSMEYLQKLKIRHACQLLENGVMSIKQVSDILAYSNQNYFCKVFSKEMGVSPLQYKKNPNPFGEKRVKLEVFHNLDDFTH